MRLSAQLAALDMIQSGTAGFIDAGSYYIGRGRRSLPRKRSSGRAVLLHHGSERTARFHRNGCRRAIRRTDALYDAFHGKGNLKVYYSLRSLISCSRELMEAAGSRARERGTMLQAHMNEYPGEINFFMEREQMRPYEYLEKLGILGENFIGAHSLLLSEDEKQLLAQRGVNVCHCPFSNCGKAAPDTPSLMSKGIPVSLGTDGAAHGGLSLWNEMKIFRSVMNLHFGVP